MITSKTSIDQMYPELTPIRKNTDIASQNTNSSKNTNGSGAEATASVKINVSLFEFAIPQSARSAVNMVAASVRRANRAMLEIEKQIDRMKDRLIKHIKNFPPFLPGSEERVKLMKRFSMFRRQIDQLTFPPDDPGAAQIMADPSVTGKAGDWSLDSDDDENQMTIHRQPVHTGSEGLNIKDLSEEATDEEIYASIKTLDSASEVLRQRRSDLAADFEGILNQMRFGDSLKTGTK